MHDTLMPAHWNATYVILSVFIASITSFFALELARRFRGDGNVTAPLVLGAVLGYGIWAMHFIGMMAMQLPTSVAYGMPLTLLSGVCAVVFLVAASAFMFNGTPTFARMLGSGLIAGTGIVLMHYIGMAALQLNAATHYLVLPFALSVLIAVGAATVAFFLFSRVMTAQLTRGLRLAVQFGAALVMGLAIAGMHYTGMAAIQFMPDPTSTTVVSGVNPQDLLFLVLGSTLVIFVITFTFILADQLAGSPAGASSD